MKEAEGRRSTQINWAKSFEMEGRAISWTSNCQYLFCSGDTGKPPGSFTSSLGNSHDLGVLRLAALLPRSAKGEKEKEERVRRRGFYKKFRAAVLHVKENK